ncbi:hypothetical protein [Arsenophonus sp.]|uniref:hypothetical protein n=1 Tax=Arsenophonus sp. TaxID=1872640 RepID=UPI00285D1D99|nr:hypothetical protein [Arsenophonus sp.]MDR5617278.1 hypothetical protein [Arsenophonus sp.]
MSDKLNLKNIEGNVQIFRDKQFEEQYNEIYKLVYKEINKVESEKSKKYSDNLKIDLGEIKEIHYKILQTIDIFDARASVLEIIITQSKGQVHKFNDFDKFLASNLTSPYPTREIIIQYNFITSNKEGNSFEKYRITNELSSKVALFDYFIKNNPPFMLDMFSMISFSTAEICVEYSDYVKARSFFSAFEEWVQGCDKYIDLKVIEVIINIINKFAWIIKLLILTIFAYGSWSSICNYKMNIIWFVKFAITYSMLFLIIYKITDKLLGKIRATMFGCLSMSYIEINKGDENLIKKYSKYNNKNLFKGLLCGVSTILIGVISSFLYDIIKYLYGF